VYPFMLASMGPGERLLRIEPGDRPGSYRLHGELDLDTVPQLEAVLVEERTAGRSVSLDMSDVSYMGSEGLRLLLAFAAPERPVMILRPSSIVRRLLEVALPRGGPGIEIDMEH
jgi:anti-anti-sigma factor